MRVFFHSLFSLVHSKQEEEKVLEDNIYSLESDWQDAIKSNSKLVSIYEAFLSWRKEETHEKKVAFETLMPAADTAEYHDIHFAIEQRYASVENSEMLRTLKEVQIIGQSVFYLIFSIISVIITFLDISQRIIKLKGPEPALSQLAAQSDPLDDQPSMVMFV